MKLNRIDLSVLENRWLKRYLLIMRLICILTLVFTLNLSASVWSQNNAMSINLKNSTLQELFTQIEKNSNYRFFYNNDEVDVNRRISIDVEEKTVGKILSIALDGTPYSFKEMDNKLILIEKAAGVNKISGGESQQQKVVTGKVTDSSGGPLPGVSVVLKGTTTGVITDSEGKFSLPKVPDDAVVVFSFVGMKTKEIRVDGKNNVNVTLEDETIGIEEVVAVGYGTQKKGSVTGSVASINSENILSIKTANVTNTLAGKLPGLRAVQRSGAPGDDAASIDIRGFGNPLVIVDGIERDFKQIDANDIESVSVLKDASAAVYGFKGANGVILITTKKGTVSKPKIEYSAYWGLQQVTRYPELLNGYEYATLYNEAQQNVGVNAPYSEEQLKNFKAGIGTTNWWNEVVRKFSPQQFHHINVSGGTEKVKYYFSFASTDQDGMYRSDDYTYKKYNVRSNISAQVTNDLTVELQLSGLLDSRNKPYEADPLSRSIQMARPIYTIYANNNEMYWQNPGDKGNPVHLSKIDQVGYDKRDRRQFNGTVIFNWKLPWIKGLSGKALLGYDYNNSYTRQWYKAYKEYNYNSSSDQYVVQANHSISELTTNSANYFKPTQQYSLNYDGKFGDHNINGLLLWEMYNDRNDWVQAYRQFTVSAIDQINAGDNVNKNNGGSASESAHQGLVGRINYAYVSKYLAEVSFRYDGSYKFDPDKRWGFFPAVSLGWRVSEEPFFKLTLPYVENFKIRGSYGKVGDEGDFSAFQYLSGYTYPTGSYVLGSTGVSNGAVDKGMPNTGLTWYESTTANAGFELSAWKGLLGLEFDYFYRKRDGLLATRQLTLPTTFGQSLPQENLNSDNTKGFEIVLNHRNKIGEFTYSVKANLSTTRESYGYIERAASSNMYDNWKNNTNDRFKSISWGKIALGQFQSFAEILNSPIQDNNGNKSLLPGDIKYKDVNNDGLIDGKDDQPIGYGSTPRIYYGLNLNCEYKGFDVTLFFQGAGGHDVFVGGDFLDPFIQQGLGNGITLWMDRWHRADPTDMNSAWISGEMPALRPTGFSANRAQSTWTLHNANYLRLKTLEIGYTLPGKLIKTVGFDNVRIYVNSLNTLTFTSNKGIMKYMDPENNESSLRYYPQMKTFNVGINLSF
jgi:TonB-linked outer membrane protein, SusC/RagA family